MYCRHLIPVLLYASLLNPCLVHAQGEFIKFKHITSADGLSQNHGLCIARDYKGFMWFGTEDGLNKYDGYGMTVYKHDPADSASLTGNVIYAVYEDSKYNLWIGTESGLNLYDRGNDRFIRFTHDQLNIHSVSNNYIVTIFEDSDNNLWIGTGAGISRFDYETNTFSHIPLLEKYEPAIDIFEDSKKNIWIGSHRNRFYLLDRKTNALTSYESPHAVSSVLEDDSGNLWVGTWNGGLKLFDTSKRTFTKVFMHSERNSQSIGSNVVYELFKDSSGKIWVGTENGGLSLFHPKTGTFTRYVNEPDNKESISNNSVDAIYEDIEGTIWIGVHRGGINYFNTSKEKFKSIKQMPCNTGLSNNNIKSICEDKKGNIWIGTDGGGLNCFDHTSQSFRYYRHNTDNANSLSSDVVLSVLEDSDGIFWIGTYREGLNRYDPKNNTFTRYKNDPSDSTSLSYDNVWCIFEDHQKYLWIGTLGQGVSRFDKRTGKFKRFPYYKNDSDQNYLSNPVVYCIYQDSRQKLWIGTSNGLNRYNPENETFTSYLHDDQNKNSISHSQVLAIFEDSNGNLWVGTRSGLNRFNEKNQTFQSFTIRDGLPNNVINSILEDDRGNLWLGTLGGLSRFDRKSNTFKNYSIEDGLLTNEFSQNAALKTRNGKMFFGGISGINFFHPDSVKDNLSIPTVLLTDFQIFNKRIRIGEDSPLKQNINEAKEIVISHRESVFTIEFAALNYIFTGKNQYAYKMEGFDSDWNYVGSKRTANYTNLNPGKYTFKVRGSNNDGVWNYEGTSIRVIITPPFWKTWWFRLLMVFSLTGGMLTIYRVRVSAVQKQKAELIRQVAERTTDLQKANTELTFQKEAIQQHRTELEHLYVEIKDSVRAAQAIQQSILPSEAIIQEHFPQSFILNNPKAVIGGDFYWFNVFEEKTVLAVADCTGHGVSGAFMSINAHHLINQAVYSHRHSLVASEVLDRLHAAVIKELRAEKENSMIRDGMDISLCIFDKGSWQLQYAGANNPLYILRNNEVMQIAPDKFPIGLSINGKSYTFKNNSITLQPGDTLYMFSDGYADQFGGENGEEKFTYNRFRNLLLRIYREPLDVQKTLLTENLSDWKKDTPQLDDILIIGLRV